MLQSEEYSMPTNLVCPPISTRAWASRLLVFMPLSVVSPLAKPGGLNTDRIWLESDSTTGAIILAAINHLSTMSVNYDGLTFDRIGHASVRIETADGVVIYIDPWSEVLETKPGDGDLVLITHDDFDHYDPAGIEAVAGPETTVAAYEAVDTRDLPYEVVQLPHEGTRTIAGIEIESIPAHNDPAGDHVDDEGNPFHAEGEVIGVILTIGDTSIYFPSDTDFLPQHEAIRAEVFLPPIGGHYTMDRHEAAEFTRSVAPDLVLPLHYGTFDAIETDAQAFADEIEREGIRVELF